MGILKAIGKFFAGGATEAAGDVADIVERWKPGVTTKHQMEMDVASLVEQARQHDTPVANGGLLGNIADGLNRLIRPVVTIYILGGLFGMFNPEFNQNIDPWFLAQGEKIIIFWFGGKVLLKDLPAAITYLRRN
jgi:hypothetical protein